MPAHLAQVGYVADMVPLPILFDVVVDHLPTRDRLYKLERLEDRDGVCPSTTYVIDFSASRITDELGHEGDHVIRVDIVPHLLALVPENGVLLSLHIAPYQVAEKAV